MLLSRRSVLLFFLALSLGLSISSCRSSRHGGKEKQGSGKDHGSGKAGSGKGDSGHDRSSDKVDKVLKTAYSYLGTPYRYGGMDRNGMDCSGLVYNSFKAVDVTLPHSSRDQSKLGKKIDIDDLRKGDLVFFCTKGKNDGDINHVGIVSSVESKEKIWFIHASTKKGVVVNNIFEPYYKSAYVKAVRIL